MADFTWPGRCRLPGRCFRSQGVVTWTVGFATRPSVVRFTASFNSETHEILLTDPVQNVAQGSKGTRSNKGRGKGAKSNPSNTVEQNPSIVEHERVSKLEARVDTMEKKQHQIENRINDGFSNVQDQLRQLLQVVQPRAPSPAKTGMTPPSKASKTG